MVPLRARVAGFCVWRTDMGMGYGKPAKPGKKGKGGKKGGKS